MMQLIQQLAACKSYDFSGWFLAEASLCLEGKAHSFSLEICRKTERRAVLQVLGWDEGGRCRQSLTVLLVKPLSLSREIISAEAEGAPDGEVLWRHVFLMRKYRITWPSAAMPTKYIGERGPSSPDCAFWNGCCRRWMKTAFAGAANSESPYMPAKSSASWRRLPV